MQRILFLVLIAVVLAGILYACNTGNTEEATPAALAELPGLTLTVQAQSGTFNTVGQTINYQYTVTNSGSTALTGPVTVTDNKMAVTCPQVNTVGNADGNLDPTESIVCVGAYTITQADLNAGSVTNTSTASAGGINSNTTNTNVPMTLAKSLELTSVPNPTTYNQAGQVITFTYTIKNIGTTTLGPAQFIIHDDRLGNINCGGTDMTLAANQSFNCTATYTTTDADRNASQLVFNTIVSGGGASNTQPVKVTIENTLTTNPSNLTPGSTIKHQVNPGEWMIQIARCYGADFKAVRNANPQVIDPHWIFANEDILTIPNIGSNGKIYGPPCVTYYTAQSGDTWQSLATKFNADIDVLLAANKGVSLANGVKLKIPLNSAGGNPIPPVSNEPIRLNFPAGSNSVTLSGTVSVSKVKDRYVLTASQGQTLSVKVTAPASEFQLAILSKSGTVLKAQDATLTWTSTIPSNGDYYIDVVNVTSADKLYTLEVSLTSPTAAFERVADINAGAPDSNPSYLTVFNNVLYFNATGNGGNGAELWKYDAASNAVNLVSDVRPGAESSNPSYLREFNGALYFSANGGDGAGNELWRFNGSATGRLTDINPGVGDANPAYMTVFNGSLYFSANGNDGAGIELWKTDGTTYSRVADIYAGDGSSNPAYLAVYNNALYFSAVSNDGAGTELWKYDGTNVSRVTDINPGVGNSNPAFLTVFNNVLYFNANGNDGAGTELWKYDGTNAGRVADINPGTADSNPTYLTVFNNALYFSATSNDNAGFELWKFDGSTVSRISDINKTGGSFPAFPAVYNNQVYFQADGGDGAGKELWRYKGQ